MTELKRREKHTKTHQQRRISLDKPTIDVLRAHFADLDETATKLSSKADPQAFVFSYSPSGDKPMHPSTVTHRYGVEVAEQLRQGLGVVRVGSRTAPSFIP